MVSAAVVRFSASRHLRYAQGAMAAGSQAAASATSPLRTARKALTLVSAPSTRPVALVRAASISFARSASTFVSDPSAMMASVSHRCTQASLNFPLSSQMPSSSPMPSLSTSAQPPSAISLPLQMPSSSPRQVSSPSHSPFLFLSASAEAGSPRISCTGHSSLRFLAMLLKSSDSSRPVSFFARALTFFSWVFWLVLK